MEAALEESILVILGVPSYRIFEALLAVADNSVVLPSMMPDAEVAVTVAVPMVHSLASIELADLAVSEAVLISPLRVASEAPESSQTALSA